MLTKIVVVRLSASQNDVYFSRRVGRWGFSETRRTMDALQTERLCSRCFELGGKIHVRTPISYSVDFVEV